MKSLAFLILFVAAAATGAEVTVTGVAANHSSAKIHFAPIAGAQDYRVYDVTNPNDVKYAGLTHLKAGPGCTGRTAVDQAAGASCFQHFVTQSDGSLAFPFRVTPFSYPNGAQGGPTGYDGPALEIDYNTLGDGQPHTLIVEAVDALGPVPFDNLYQMVKYHPVALSPHMEGMTYMLGGNKGGTLDGKVSTNGQGPYTNKPNVIARSRPFVVQADRNVVPVPSRSDATQIFLDTFENSETLKLISQSDGANAQGDVGLMQYTLNAGTPKAWDIFYRQCDNTNSMPFISNNHFMDVLFDREATLYCSMSMSPRQSFTLNGGILHLSMQVDDVLFRDRWLDFHFAPAADPLTHWNYQDKAVNNNNQALYVSMFGDTCELRIFNGPKPEADLQTPATDPGNMWQCNLGELYDPQTFTVNGLGFDNKRTADLFLSGTRIALFVDGRLVSQNAIPAGSFTWSNQALRAYFTHYQYHSDIGDEAQMNVDRTMFCQPLLSYWFDDVINGVKAGPPNTCDRDYPPGVGFRGSDERHWDNVAVEMIPASAAPAGDFSSLAALVKPATIRAPVFSDAPPPVVTPPPVITPPPVVTPVTICNPDVVLPTLGIKYGVCVTVTPVP